MDRRIVVAEFIMNCVVCMAMAYEMSIYMRGEIYLSKSFEGCLFIIVQYIYIQLNLIDKISLRQNNII